MSSSSGDHMLECFFSIKPLIVLLFDKDYHCVVQPDGGGGVLFFSFLKTIYHQIL